MKAAIMEIVKGLESHVVQDVLINKSVHPVSIIFTVFIKCYNFLLLLKFSVSLAIEGAISES